MTGFTGRRSRWLTFGVVAAALATTLLAVPAQARVPAQAQAQSAMVSVRLHIIRITCYGKNDTWGSDEPYFNVNGTRVWRQGNVDYLETVQVDVYTPFDDVATVEMWEDDGGLTGQDDLMGRWFMFSGEVTSGVQSVWTSWSGGRYVVYYEVVP
jgi:hypothetical protein